MDVLVHVRKLDRQELKVSHSASRHSKETWMPNPGEMPDYLQKRLSNVRAAMRHKKIPALLVTNFADVSWLTGFEGHDSYALVTADRFLLLSDFRYQEQAAKECPWVELLLRE